MSKQKFITIGHIVNDTKPTDHIGGPVSYMSVTASRLGYESHIITKLPQNHRYIAELKKNYGVTVHQLPTKLDTIETNVNIYDDHGRKHFKKLAQQEPITIDDLKTIPKELFDNAMILAASDSGEVNLDTFP